MKRLIYLLFIALLIAGCQKQFVPGKQRYVPVVTTPHDSGEGDPLATAFEKVNAGFVDVYDSLGNIYTEAQTDQAVVDYFDGVLATAGTGVNWADSLLYTEGGYVTKYSQSGIYNILDYGAISGDDTDDSDAINAAGTAAAAVGTGGIVLIPPGDYDVESPIIIHSLIEFKAYGAYITADMDTTEAIFQSPVDEAIYDFYISGGYYYANWKCNFLNLYSPETDYYVMFGRIKDAYIYRVDICFNLISDTDGWITSNIFDNVIMMQCGEMLRTRHDAYNCISANVFNNLQFNAGTYTTFGIDSLSGRGNLFNNLVFWDFDDDPDNGLAIVLAASSSDNQINGTYLPTGFLEEDVLDLGTNNRIRMNGSKTQSCLATVDGLTTGIIFPRSEFITVTSNSANHICHLPIASASTIGTIIRGQCNTANGFELRVAISQYATVSLNDVKTNVEAAIPAWCSFEVIQVDTNYWILKAWTALGAVITAIVPDAI